MQTTTETAAIVYNGDQYPDKLNREQTTLAVESLRTALDIFVMDQPTSEAAKAVLLVVNLPAIAGKRAGYLDGALTTQLVDAVLAAEKAFHEVEDEYQSNDGFFLAHQALQTALRATGRRLVEYGTKRGWLPLDIFVVALEDDLEHYNFPDWLKGKVKSIREIRFFDRNQVTHLCSFEGSYFLEFVDVQVTLMDEYQDDDKFRYRADEWVQEANSGSEADYYDQKRIDRLLAKNEPGTVYHSGNPCLSWDEAEGDDEEAKHRTMMEAVREGLASNSVL